MCRITCYKRRTYILESEYGAISYLQWCNKEIERLSDEHTTYTLKEKGDKVAIIKKEIKCT